LVIGEGRTVNERLVISEQRNVRVHSRLADRYSLFAMPDPAHALTLQLLAWIAESPRTYAQAMEAWRSTCPRLSIWEDAILDGLVAVAGGTTRDLSRVVLTQKGRARLRGGAAPVAANAGRQRQQKRPPVTAAS
jgi:hypothetical protein